MCVELRWQGGNIRSRILKLQKKEGKQTSPAHDEIPSVSSQGVDPGDDSEPEFDNIEKTLGESLSYESLTWMRHIIRVQAKEIVRSILKEEKAKNDGNSTINEMTNQLGELTKKLADIKGEVESLRSENAKQRRQIERLEHLNFKNQSSIHKLKVKVDELDQEKHALSLQIVGLAESKDKADDIKQLAKVLKDKAGVKIKSADVIEMKRLGKQNDVKARNVIVSFKDKETRQKIFRERKKLITEGNPSKSVYLNDSLTQHRQQLLYAARRLVKARKLYAAWSQDGNILVRKLETSKITQVFDNDDLMVIKTDETQSDQDHETIDLSGEISSDVSHLSNYSFYCDSDI